jgi:hypothetical protein
MNKLNFLQRLELGNDKEYYVNDILNLCSIPSRLNNLKNVKDIDLYLYEHNIYVDVKYAGSSFPDSKFYADIEPSDCLIVDKRHVSNYEAKRMEENVDTWIAFLIEFDDYDVFELRFIRTEDILKLVYDEKAIVRSIKSQNRKMIINLNKNDCLTMIEFVDYLRGLTKGD